MVDKICSTCGYGWEFDHDRHHVCAAIIKDKYDALKVENERLRKQVWKERKNART